jgi:hypothetical protein
MGYKQQSGDADKLLKAFRHAVSQFSKSKKEEGETTWLQRRRHGIGHAVSTYLTYAALRAVCPATILGNKYFARGLYGAATSVIRDVSRGNLNKKSILRALAGAGIAVGATVAGEMINPNLMHNDIEMNGYSSRSSVGMGGGDYNLRTTANGEYVKAGNLGTKIRSIFDRALRDKMGLKGWDASVDGRYEIAGNGLENVRKTFERQAAELASRMARAGVPQEIIDQKIKELGQQTVQGF